MNNRDWTLLAIDAANPGALTPVQLQKALFLLGQQVPNEVGPGFYNFIPYNYGPFSKEIYSDSEWLRDQGLVEEISKPGQNWREYVVSPAGHLRAEALKAEAPVTAVGYLDAVVKWIGRLSFQDLLHSVYAAYPKFAENSVFNR